MMVVTLFLIFIGVVAEVHRNDCTSFQDAMFGKSAKSSDKWCNAISTIKKCSKIGLYGTDYYKEDSPVCLAAIHAGVLLPDENRTVTFQRNEYTHTYTGLVRNRVKSDSYDSTIPIESFKFTSPFQTGGMYDENSWLTDVYMLHDQYKDKRILKVACISDGPSLPNNNFYRWTGNEIFENIKVKKSDAIISTTDNGCVKWWNKCSARWFYGIRSATCRGKHPVSDVNGVFNRPEVCKASQSTYSVSIGEKLSMNISCSEEIRKLSFKRFPDKDPNNHFDSNESGIYNFEEIYSTSEALYEVIPDNRAYEKIYFKLIVRNCPPNKYGSNCSHNCQKCENGGVCHDITGSCICPPGFNGRLCDKICPLSYFGSKCHLSCSNDQVNFINGGFTSSTSCQNIVFCQPDPYGCTCAHGYEGIRCNKRGTLLLPELRHGPDVKILNNNTAFIEFNQWESEDFGDLYGQQVSEYKIRLKQKEDRYWMDFTEKQNSRSPRQLVTTDIIIKKGTVYEAKVEVHLDQNKFWGFKPTFKQQVTEFISPCFDPDTGIKIMNRNSTSLMIMGPAPHNKMNFSFWCWAEAEKVHNKEITENTACADKELSENQILFNCTISGLEAGMKYIVRTKCKNIFGVCNDNNPQKNAFTIAELEAYFDYFTFNVYIRNFDLMRQKNSELKIFAWEENENEEWDKTGCSIPHNELSSRELSPSDIKRDLEDSLKDIQFVSLNRFLNQKLPFNIGLLFTYNIENKTHCAKLQIMATQNFLQQQYNYRYLGFTAIIPIIIIIILIIVKYKTDRKHAKQEAERNKLYKYKKKTKALRSSLQVQPIYFDHEKVANVYMNRTFYSPIFEDEVTSLIRSVPLSVKFSEIPKVDSDMSMNVALLPDNVRKNRYRDNIPYDSTRVVLSRIPEDPSSDYINASHVRSSLIPYIACQGPKDENKDTVEDFWRMVLEKRVFTIIMIANFVEGGKKKVAEYFSRENLLMFGSITVEVKATASFPVEKNVFNSQYPQYPVRQQYIHSIIEVKCGIQSRTINHYQFIAWPDHGIPNNSFSTALMLHNVKNYHQDGSMVVHCSAGIGRTGTVLLVLLMIDMYEESSRIQPIECLKLLRAGRPKLIENYAQFNFGVEVFYDFYFGVKNVVTFQDITNQRIDQLVHHFSEEYRDDYVGGHTFQYAQNSQNLPYNRNTSILPPDLSLVEVNENRFYINAVEIDLEYLSRGLVVTEHPLSTTLQYFWAIVMEKSVSVLILLNESVADEHFPEILPKVAGEILIEDIVLSISSYIDNGDFTTTYYISLRQNQQYHELQVIQVNGWYSSMTVPPNNSNILLKLLNVVLNNESKEEKTMICCEDGITACSLVIGIVLLFEHLLQYDEVNLYRTMMKMRRYHPKYIASKDQFLHLFWTLRNAVPYYC